MWRAISSHLAERVRAALARLGVCFVRDLRRRARLVAAVEQQQRSMTVTLVVERPDPYATRHCQPRRAAARATWRAARRRHRTGRACCHAPCCRRRPPSPPRTAPPRAREAASPTRRSRGGGAPRNHPVRASAPPPPKPPRVSRVARSRACVGAPTTAQTDTRDAHIARQGSALENTNARARTTVSTCSPVSWVKRRLESRGRRHTARRDLATLAWRLANDQV